MPRIRGNGEKISRNALLQSDPGEGIMKSPGNPSQSARTQEHKMKLNLGENIRKHRRRLDLTQDELAERLGVSFQTVSRWENGVSHT